MAKKKARAKPETMEQEVKRLKNDVAFLDQDRLLMREELVLMQRALEEMALAILNRSPKPVGRYTRRTH